MLIICIRLILIVFVKFVIGVLSGWFLNGFCIKMEVFLIVIKMIGILKIIIIFIIRCLFFNLKGSIVVKIYMIKWINKLWVLGKIVFFIFLYLFMELYNLVIVLFICIC